MGQKYRVPKKKRLVKGKCSQNLLPNRVNPKPYWVKKKLLDRKNRPKLSKTSGPAWGFSFWPAKWRKRSSFGNPWELIIRFRLCLKAPWWSTRLHQFDPKGMHSPTSQQELYVPALWASWTNDPKPPNPQTLHPPNGRTTLARPNGLAWTRDIFRRNSWFSAFISALGAFVWSFLSA